MSAKRWQLATGLALDLLVGLRLDSLVNSLLNHFDIYGVKPVSAHEPVAILLL